MSRVFDASCSPEEIVTVTAGDVRHAREFFEAHPDRHSRGEFARNVRGYAVGFAETAHSFCLLGAIGRSINHRSAKTGVDLVPLLEATARLRGLNPKSHLDQIAARDIITNVNDTGTVKDVIDLLREIESEMRKQIDAGAGQ